MVRKKKEIQCKYCGNWRVVKMGKVSTRQGLKQRYICRNCGKTFYKENLDLHPLVALVEPSDPNYKLRQRYIELAAMFKEVKEGTMTTLNIIINRFKIQMGVKDSTVKEYLKALTGAGLLIVKQGSGKWYYNEDAEWELFKINI